MVLLGHHCYLGTFLVAASWASHCGGFSRCRAHSLGTWASTVGAAVLQNSGAAVWCTGLSCLWRVESFWTRDLSGVPYPLYKQGRPKFLL